MKRARLRGIAAERARRSRCRLRHSARSVRADMPLSSRMALQRQERVEHRRRARARTASRRARRSSSSIAENSASIGDRRRVATGNSRACRFCSRIDVDLAHELGGAVVALHQLLARALAPACRRGRARARAPSAGRTPGGPRAGRRDSAAARAVAPISRSCRDTARASPQRDEPVRASSRQVRPRPAARAIHSTVCRSRSPPGLSLTFGSRL